MPPQRTLPQCRGRGRAGELYARNRGTSGVRSPLGQSQDSSSSSMSPGASSAPTTSVEEIIEESIASSEWRKRKWNSPVWLHYNLFEGNKYEDGIPRAFCKYCQGGPILAPSSLGTFNFIRHIHDCTARPTGDIGQIIIEQEGTKDVHTYLNDNAKVMSRNTAKNYCMKIHKREKQNLKEKLATLNGNVAVTLDMWTSCVGQGYLSLTSHYVDNDWILQVMILNFYHLEPPHDAFSIHAKVMEFIKEWGLTKKVYTVTLDNARCNDNMQNLLAASLKVYAPLYCDEKYFHVRCGAHVLNLIVQEGLKLCDSGVAKVKELVTYICCSECRLLEFEENAIANGLNCSKGLSMDCATRWNSTFKMLCRALYFRCAFMSMSLSTRYDLTFPPLPTEVEWARIDKICALLKPFHEITTLTPGRKHPTSNLYLKCVWKIESLLLEYGSCEDEFVGAMAQSMKVKFDKYWDSYSLILSFAAILDPRYKYQFVRYCFTELDGATAEVKSKAVKDELYNLFEEYVKMDPSVTENCVPIRVQDELPGFVAFSNDVRRVSSTQLDVYLEETRVDHTLEIYILLWWKENQKRFPIVAAMTKDILAIPVTTVASESSFSMGSRIITK